MSMTELAKGVYWVGHVDWDCRDFHGYSTDRGVTYNAYLIVDEKVALIDAVKAPFADRLIEHIKAIYPLEKIDYIVINHGEPDHAGAIKAVRQAAPNAQLVASKKGAETLKAYYGVDTADVQMVTTGDAISLGKRNIEFITTAMLHWPDSMATLLPEEGILFSMDGFGQHLASSRRFDDELDWSLVEYEMKRYYANILTPFKKVARGVLAKLKDVDVRMIAPSHGLILRSHVADSLACYQRWSSDQTVARVDVVYDTMWTSTAQMAEAIYTGVLDSGAAATFKHARRSTLTDLATDALDAGAVAIGTPTLNTGMLPSIASYITYVGNLRPAPVPALVYGSYGWRAAGVERASEMLGALAYDVIDETLTIKWKPDEEGLSRCRDAGRRLGERVLANAG